MSSASATCAPGRRGAGDDHVREPVVQVEIAVGVEGAAVAGTQPAAGEHHLGGRPGFTPDCRGDTTVNGVARAVYGDDEPGPFGPIGLEGS